MWNRCLIFEIGILVTHHRRNVLSTTVCRNTLEVVRRHTFRTPTAEANRIFLIAFSHDRVPKNAAM